jgi:hypothetical protein
MVDMPGIISVNEYIKAAIREENATVDNKSDTSFDTEEMNEIIAEEDEIKKNIKMGKTFVSLFSKKAKSMQVGKNPLGKKLAEEFQSCADLLRGSIIETIDNQDEKDIISTKSELKNLIN